MLGLEMTTLIYINSPTGNKLFMRASDENGSPFAICVSDSHATITKTYFARLKVKENQELWAACLITKLVVPKLSKLVYTMKIH